MCINYSDYCEFDDHIVNKQHYKYEDFIFDNLHKAKDIVGNMNFEDMDHICDYINEQIVQRYREYMFEDVCLENLNDISKNKVYRVVAYDVWENFTTNDGYIFPRMINNFEEATYTGYKDHDLCDKKVEHYSMEGYDDIKDVHMTFDLFDCLDSAKINMDHEDYSYYCYGGVITRVIDVTPSGVKSARK